MDDTYVGEITMFGGNFAPLGWVMCDGQLLSTKNYPNLFHVIGTTYGGDGRTTFAVPDLCGRIPVGAGRNPETGTDFNLAQAGGTETVALTVQQLPSHSHAARCQSAAGNSAGSENKFWATTSGQVLYQPAAADAAMAPTATSTVGGGQAHSNEMPFLPLNFIIAWAGDMFPMQD